MGQPIDTIVKVDISQQTQVAVQQGFGVPLIMGPTGFDDSDLFRVYTTPSELLEDGFLTSDPEYIRAVEACEQELSPSEFLVGKYSSAIAQIDTITPTAVNNHHYKIKIDGVEYDYLSDGSATVNEIVAGLLALVNADTAAAALASGTVTLILTAKVAGVGFTTDIESDPNMALVHTLANHSISQDIAAIQALPGGDVWYGVTISSQTGADILQVASYIETQKKIFIADPTDAQIPDNSITTDVASVLKGKSYKRTAALFAGTNNDGRAAAWLGGQLPQVPGESTWKFKKLVGITPDDFTSTERVTLIGNPLAGIAAQKNCNIYELIGQTPITEEGFMSGGQFIDITVGIDWLEATMKSEVFAAIATPPKVPYTDQGASIVEAAIRSVLAQGVANQLLDGASIEVTVPAVLDESVSNRANRILAGVKWSARLAGAFHFVSIQGTVTV